MKRTIKMQGQRGLLKVDVSLTYTEQNAYTPDAKKEVERIRNRLVDFLRNSDFNYSEIKEIK